MKYQRKPQYVEAIQFTGDNFELEGLCRCGKGVSGLHTHRDQDMSIVRPGDMIIYQVINGQKVASPMHPAAFENTFEAI